jgi:GT2 family glycosyltransferase
VTTDRISVVVVTRNRRESLLRTLARLHAAPHPPPVLVVDNGSSDGTVEAVRRAWPRVRVLPLGRNLGAAGRTEGVLAATTPYVAFSDDDSWWEPGALRRAVELFDAAPRLGLLAGRMTVHPGDREDPICAAMAAGPQSAGVPGGTDVLGFLACGAVVRRSAYLGVGGFHPRFGIGGEEELLALDLASAGWVCAYTPELLAHHEPDPAPRGADRQVRQVRNALWTAWLRRQPGAVLRRTGAVLAAGWRTGVTWSGFAAAVSGLPWVLAERRPVLPAVEARRSALDRAGRVPEPTRGRACGGTAEV